MPVIMLNYFLYHKKPRIFYFLAASRMLILLVSFISVASGGRILHSDDAKGNFNFLSHESGICLILVSSNIIGYRLSFYIYIVS